MRLDDPILRAFVVTLMQQRLMLRNSLARAHEALKLTIAPPPASERRYAALGQSYEVLQATEQLHLHEEIAALFRADPELAKECRLAAPPADAAPRPALKVVPPLESEIVATVLPFEGNTEPPAGAPIAPGDDEG